MSNIGLYTDLEITVPRTTRKQLLVSESRNGQMACACAPERRPCPSSASGNRDPIRRSDRGSGRFSVRKYESRNVAHCDYDLCDLYVSVLPTVHTDLHHSPYTIRDMGISHAWFPQAASRTATRERRTGHGTVRLFVEFCKFAIPPTKQRRCIRSHAATGSLFGASPSNCALSTSRSSFLPSSDSV